MLVIKVIVAMVVLLYCVKMSDSRLVVISSLIIDQIFSLARDWSKRIM